MFKKGDEVVCVDNNFMGCLDTGNVYKVSRVDSMFVYVEGYSGKFFPRRFRLIKPKTPIWDNKCPKDMTKEELKAFVCDRIDEVEMYHTETINGDTTPVVYTTSQLDNVSLFVSNWIYSVKPVKPVKSEKLQAAEKALEDAQAAVKAAQEAVAKAKES